MFVQINSNNYKYVMWYNIIYFSFMNFSGNL